MATLPVGRGSSPAPRFVSLRVAPDTPSVVGVGVGAGVIEILTRGGHTLRVPAGVDRQTLADVLALLEGRPC